MELIDIVDENNEITGQVEDRMVAYEKGLWRRVVSCWIINEKGELLIQKRSEKKFRSPGKWAKTGGQVDSGESPKEAIIREIKEELGVEIQKDHVLSEAMILKDNEKKLFKYSYIIYMDYKIEDYILQEEEVDKVKYVTIEEVELAKNNNYPDYIFNSWDAVNFDKEINQLKEIRTQILGKKW